MEALSALISNPLEAVSALAETVLPGAQNDTTTNATFTEDTLRMLVHNLLTGDSRLQQQMLQRYYASNATFSLNEGMLRLADRDSLAQLLTGLQLLASVEPEILEVTSTGSRAVLLVNLKLKLLLAPWTWSTYTRIQVPTTITLGFGPSPNALLSAATDDVITEHRQELSLPDLLWWNPAWPFINVRLWGPVSGKVLSTWLQLVQPLLGRMRTHTAGGAGLLQAAIWTAQDIASGLSGTSHGPTGPPSGSTSAAAATPATLPALSAPRALPDEATPAATSSAPPQALQADTGSEALPAAGGAVGGAVAGQPLPAVPSGHVVAGAGAAPPSDGVVVQGQA